MPDCGHLLCELVGDSSCSIASGRSRGCTPGITAKTVAPEVFDEVRTLLALIDRNDSKAAARLAQIIRREARDDRHLLAHVRDEHPELAPALERLCVRRA